MVDGMPPALSEEYGYSCNIWLTKEITGRLFNPNRRKVWFATTFNPVANVDSSNPCAIYTQISRAVQLGDVGSRIIKDYRSQLLSWISDRLRMDALTPQEAEHYRVHVISADISAFRPEVWRLDLRKIARRKLNVEDVAGIKTLCRQIAQQQVVNNAKQVLQPDEYLLLDLQNDEYEPIIVG